MKQSLTKLASIETKCEDCIHCVQNGVKSLGTNTNDMATFQRFAIDLTQEKIKFDSYKPMSQSLNH